MDFSHRLGSAFVPHAVAVVGASDRVGSRGTFVWNGVMNSRLALEAYPVNPKYKYIGVTPCWPSLAELPTKIDLAVIATPSSKVLSILEQCHKLGIANVLVTPGDESVTGDRHWRNLLLQKARAWGIRVIGPDSIGIMRPGIGLNVSYWPQLPATGPVGLICQSGSVTSTVLDYARRNNIGFSSVITAGRESDVSLAEIIDFLAADKETEVIALHAEMPSDPRSFFSAVRAASRIKPVIVLKSGRSATANRVIASHLASSVGSSAVFEAMLESFGAVQCERIEEFCSTLEVFAADKIPREGRMAILANGLGFAALAADAADAAGIRLAEPSSECTRTLAEIIRSATPLTNPIDVGSDASPERFAATLTHLMADDNVDGVMMVLAPSVILSTPDTIRSIAKIAKKSFKPLIVVWMSDMMPTPLRNIARDHALPCLTTPDLASRAFAHLCAFTRSKERRLTPPKEGSEVISWDQASALKIIDSARQNARHLLTEEQSAELLNAFGIQTVPSAFAKTADEAVAAACKIGFPVALKLCADGVSHKKDVGGVILDVFTEKEVTEAFDLIRKNCRNLAPMALFRGVFVQQMVRRANARELRISIITDPRLGPSIALGAGGITGEIFPETAIGIPPLTAPQAHDLIMRSRVVQSLGKFRGMPAANIDAIVQILMRLSRLVCEVPAVVELHINPIIVDETGALVLDTEVSLCSRSAQADENYSHMLVAPYPAHLSSSLSTKTGLMLLRSIRPDDFEAERRLLSRLSMQSAQLRFNKPAHEVTDAEIIAFTHIDCDREAAYVIVDDSSVGPEIHGIGRISLTPGAEHAEFGILIEDAYQCKGLGNLLMQALEQAARSRGCRRLVGYVLQGNAGMTALMTRRGYHPEPCDNAMISYTLTL